MITKLLAQVDISLGEGEDQVNIPGTSINDDSFLTILETAFALLGVIAFLVIVIAGLRFILSRGDADKAAAARRTVIYAAVGLVLAVSAFTLVSFITEAAG